MNIMVDVEQGSAEWMAFRVGIPTASNFDKILTPSGEPSKQAQKYMYTLAVERITGKKEETYQSKAMERGNIVEDEARQFYELVTDSIVTPCGIGFTDEKKLFAASPDGLIGEDGQIEIKCPIASTMCEYLLSNKLPGDYIPQIQGQLLVTGRKWSDFVAYYPGLRPLIIRVNRDEVFIGKLKAALETFCKELDSVTERIR